MELTGAGTMTDAMGFVVYEPSKGHRIYPTYSGTFVVLNKLGKPL